MTKEYREYVIRGEVDPALWDDAAASLQALGLLCVRSFEAEAASDPDTVLDISTESVHDYNYRYVSEKDDFFDCATQFGKQRSFAGKVWGRLERLHMLKSKPEVYARCTWYDAADYEAVPNLFLHTHQDRSSISRFTASGLKLESLESLLQTVNTARLDQGDAVIPCYLGRGTGALVVNFLEQFVNWKKLTVDLDNSEG